MKILLVGASGAMGKAITALIPEQIVFGISHHTVQDSPFKIRTDFTEVDTEADCIIDFSMPDNLEETLAYACRLQLPVIIGTTGFSDEQNNLIDQAAKIVPLLQASNFSLGIQVLSMLIQNVHAWLPKMDIAILEKHHRFKKDAPSGTALSLKEALVSQDEALADLAIASIRAGDIVGEHHVLFAQPYEMIEITHTATSKALFASGAITAAEWIIHKPAKRYHMHDLFTNDL